MDYINQLFLLWNLQVDYVLSKDAGKEFDKFFDAAEDEYENASRQGMTDVYWAISAIRRYVHMRMT